MREAARRRVTASSVVMLTAALLAGCAGEVNDEGGFGLPVLSAGAAQEVLTGARAKVDTREGVLSVQDDGCFTWAGAGDADGAWIVWPESAQPDPDDGGLVVLDGGASVEDGSALTAHGGLVELGDLPDGANADGYFGSFGGFCGADERGVLVLLDVTRP